jgi:steroid delta-isomerase-like uncharacterized protein
MTPEEVARSYFEAHARRDPDGLVPLYSPDVVIDITGQGIFRGPQECHDYFAALYAAVPDAEMIVDRIVGGEDLAVVQWRLRGTFTGSQLSPGIDATGGWIELRGCDVIEVADGLITRNTAYVDGMELARGLGMMPPAGSAAEKAMIAAFNLATKARQTVRDRFGQ